MRGATGVYPVKCHTCDFNPRTPRGVRRGAYTHTVWFSPYFNPRAPCGARLVALHKGGGKPGISIHALREGCDLRSALGLFGSEGISIHAPHAGRDADDDGGKRRVLISIHAPHAGRDRRCHRLRAYTKHFNPRAPCGARRGLTVLSVRLMYFNPRAPCGARLIASKWPTTAPAFQSTRPMRGATTARCSMICWTRYFNPRAPCGARQLWLRRPIRRS